MVSWLDRIRLTLGYGALPLFVGGLFNAVCTVFLSMEFYYSEILVLLILKVAVTAVVLYLNRQFENRDAVFFYINLGLSRRRMLATVLAVDYLAWAALIVIILLVR